ncbi:hypothetical protein SEA_HARAMBE_70 [Gordonia phage Harambe]|uniref:Uncharacterized protein n=1 Tax=Gordonia phage Harambe TaxID=2510575 RepID=A0A411B2V8_9CAUD|nr:hypothetical protein SEA_HARAMBE_70 [Gordonia phage Harambe]
MYPTWPEIFPTVNQPDHEHHLDWTFECGAHGCTWVTYHRSNAGAQAERERHHDNGTCPYTEVRRILDNEGRLMPAGASIIEKIWDQLDRVTKSIMEQRPRFKNDEMTEPELEGYFKLQGQAQGLAHAIHLLSVPHFEDVTAVSKWALKRYRMNAGDIEFMDTPGCKGYNPMPLPSREVGKPKKVGPTGVVSSSPSDNPKTGKYKALTDDERTHLVNMVRKNIPAGAIIGMLKISEEQYEHEVAKL